jgi:hypothetical protein
MPNLSGDFARGSIFLRKPLDSVLQGGGRSSGAVPLSGCLGPATLHDDVTSQRRTRLPERSLDYAYLTDRPFTPI